MVGLLFIFVFSSSLLGPSAINALYLVSTSVASETIILANLIGIEILTAFCISLAEIVLQRLCSINMVAVYINLSTNTAINIFKRHIAPIDILEFICSS